MSIKTETIEVRICDFCNSREQIRTCEHCGKDVCSLCGATFDLIAKSWYVYSGGATVFSGIPLSGTPPLPQVSAILCKPCQRETIQLLDDFGFHGVAAEKAKTA